MGLNMNHTINKMTLKERAHIEANRTGVPVYIVRVGRRTWLYWKDWFEEAKVMAPEITDFPEIIDTIYPRGL